MKQAAFFAIIAFFNPATAALAAEVAAVRIEATGQRFEPLQNVSPYGSSRHVSDYEYTLVWAPGSQRAREDWQLHVAYPFPGDWAFSMVYDGDRGSRSGRDGWRPGEGGVVPAARNGAAVKDFWLANPSILTAHASFQTSETLSDGALRERWTMNGVVWTILRARVDAPPHSIAVTEEDPLEGEIENRIDFSDWRLVDGVPFPFRLEQFIGGHLVRREIRRSVSIDPAGWQDLIGTPTTGAGADQAERARGWSMSQFYLRRAAMGAPADEDQSREVRFLAIGDGIYQIFGSSHLNLLVEGPDGLLIADAVWYPSRSRAILEAIKAKWPTKPIKYVVVSHHHLDHVGGIGPYTQTGATIVLAGSNQPFLADVLKRQMPQLPPMLAVGDVAKLDGIGRPIETYAIPNSHADGLLAIYVPDAKMLYNTDLYSPGRDTQNPVYEEELVRGIEFYGIDVVEHVGGHGHGIKPHDELVSNVRRNAAQIQR